MWSGFILLYDWIQQLVLVNRVMKIGVSKKMWGGGLIKASGSFWLSYTAVL